MYDSVIVMVTIAEQVQIDWFLCYDATTLFGKHTKGAYLQGKKQSRDFHLLSISWPNRTTRLGGRYYYYGLIV